jgi:hypothetical protein
MDRRHGGCSLTDSGSAALHGVMTDIAGSKYPGHIGFQEIGVAIDGGTGFPVSSITDKQVSDRLCRESMSYPVTAAPGPVRSDGRDRLNP